MFSVYFTEVLPFFIIFNRKTGKLHIQGSVRGSLTRRQSKKCHGGGKTNSGGKVGKESKATNTGIQQKHKSPTNDMIS